MQFENTSAERVSLKEQRKAVDLMSEEQKAQSLERVREQNVLRMQKAKEYAKAHPGDVVEVLMDSERDLKSIDHSIETIRPEKPFSARGKVNEVEYSVALTDTSKDYELYLPGAGQEEIISISESAADAKLVSEFTQRMGTLGMSPAATYVMVENLVMALRARDTME